MNQNNDVLDPNVDSSVVADNSVAETVENSEAHENGAENQNDHTTPDEGSQDAEGVKEPEESGDHSDESKGIKRKFRKMTEAKERALQEAEYWKREALKYAQSQTQPEPVAQDFSSQGKPKLADFNNDHEAYAEAVAEWKFEQKFKEHEQKAKTVSVVDSYNQRLQAFAKEVPDFHEVLEEAEDIKITPELQQVILESEIGPQMTYFLAKNPEEVDRINQLPPHRRLVEMGKLEDRLMAKAKPVPKTTKAPAPVSPEKGKAPVQKRLDDPNLSQAEYRAMRMAQMKR